MHAAHCREWSNPTFLILIASKVNMTVGHFWMEICVVLCRCFCGRREGLLTSRCIWHNCPERVIVSESILITSQVLNEALLSTINYKEKNMTAVSNYPSCWQLQRILQWSKHGDRSTVSPQLCPHKIRDWEKLPLCRIDLSMRIINTVEVFSFTAYDMLIVLWIGVMVFSFHSHIGRFKKKIPLFFPGYKHCSIYCFISSSVDKIPFRVCNSAFRISFNLDQLKEIVLWKTRSLSTFLFWTDFEIQ